MRPSDVSFGRFFFRVTACHIVLATLVFLMSIAGAVMPQPELLQ